MASKRKKCPSIAAEVLEERVAAQREDLNELKSGVQSILSAVNQMNLHVAKLPSWDSVKQLHTETRETIEGVHIRVKALEDEATEAKGSKKVLLTVAGFAGGGVSALIGWAMTYFSAPKPPHTP